MKETAGETGPVLERFTGFIFDASLIIAAFLAFQPLVALVEKTPNFSVAVSLIANCLAAGLTLAAVLNGAKLPSLMGFEGLLLILTPASALAMPFVYGFLAPEGVLNKWVWSMPLVALFSTLIVFGAMTDNLGAKSRSLFFIRTVSAFVCLITTEALLIAFTRPGVETLALSSAITIMTICWMPARLISAGINSSRIEMLSALAAYGLFISTILRG